MFGVIKWRDAAIVKHESDRFVVTSGLCRSCRSDPLCLSTAAEGASSIVTPTMKRTFFTVICVATLAVACWERHAESNEQRGYFVSDGHTYRVELTGWRFPLVHDPLSFLLEHTRKATLTMELPRLEDVVDGSEIPVSPDKLRHVDGRDQVGGIPRRLCL